MIFKHFLEMKQIASVKFLPKPSWDKISLLMNQNLEMCRYHIRHTVSHLVIDFAVASKDYHGL